MYTTLIQDIILTYLLPIGNLTVFQKGLFYFEIRVLNEHPSTMEDLSYDVKQMKLALKSFFFLNTFIVGWNILTGGN